MESNSKYPRTYHIPWSPGATSDDKKLPNEWFYTYWVGEEIVIFNDAVFVNGDHFYLFDHVCVERAVD